MTPEERLEAFEDLLERLVEASADALVVVEGDKDETALRELGLHGAIVRLNQGMPVFRLCEELAAEADAIIILTDWDRKGGQLARLLRDGLAANGVRADLEFRRELAGVAHVKTVEGLASWLGTLRARAAPPGAGGRGGRRPERGG